MSKVYTEQKATTLKEAKEAIDKAIIANGFDAVVDMEMDIFDEDETYVGHIGSAVEGL